MSDESLTVLKYKIGTRYAFHVMDKFDEADEPKRLDRMISYSATLRELHGDKYTELWIKTCPIFPTK